MENFLQIQRTLQKVFLASIVYSKNVVDRPVLDEMEFSRISEEDALWLDRPFDEEEVHGVITGFNVDKAPGPNGFSMAFFQSCWSVLKKEIMEVFQNFHTQAIFERSLNIAFLALTPKKVDVLEIKDFLPLSLKRQMLWRSRIFDHSI